MSKTFEQHLAELPTNIGLHIFEYVDLTKDRIHFDEFDPEVFYRNCQETNYHRAYQVAFLENGERFSKNKGRDLYLLQRIVKKNGKHRYYITKETRESMCNGCGSYTCTSHYCRGSFTDEYYYSAQYVGKNLDIALFKFNLINN